MESDRFDALTRRLSSRRLVLGGLLGGVATLLGLRRPEEADAHILPLSRCRRLQEPSLRRFCLQRVRQHNRRHQYCLRQTLALACRHVDCGVVTDGCGRRRNCGPCSSHQSCLSNNGCATVCTPHPCIGDTPRYCPPGCVCSREADPGSTVLHCLNESDPNYQCNVLPPSYCTTTKDCRVGYKCEPVPCGPGGALERRCVATCSGPVFPCRQYGESCADGSPCCCGVPCSGGLCRYP